MCASDEALIGGEQYAKNEVWGRGETAGYWHTMLTKSKEGWGETDQENQQGERKQNQDGIKETHALMIKVIHFRPTCTHCDLQPENTINTKRNSLLPLSKIYSKNSQLVLSASYNILLFRTNGTT